MSYLNIPGIPFPVAEYNRVRVTKDVLRADGRLRVEQGAIGTIVTRHMSQCTVVFDIGVEYVEPDGGGRRCQDVHALDLDTLQNL